VARASAVATLRFTGDDAPSAGRCREFLPWRKTWP